jgi:hypothetical protein
MVSVPTRASRTTSSTACRCSCQCRARPGRESAAWAAADGSTAFRRTCSRTRAVPTLDCSTRGTTSAVLLMLSLLLLLKAPAPPPPPHTENGTLQRAGKSSFHCLLLRSLLLLLPRHVWLSAKPTTWLVAAVCVRRTRSTRLSRSLLCGCKLNARRDPLFYLLLLLLVNQFVFVKRGESERKAR